MSTIRKASRHQVKIKLGFAGPAGSGKTMSSLLTAYGLCNDWNKILLIDTENGSGELYSNLGEYNVITLTPPFTPESYIEAIKDAEAAGMEVIIVDSVSHEWEGKGGILETHSNMTGNIFTNWGKVTPRHNKFVEAILQSKCHVICTLRTKTDYVLVEKNGKQVPEKVGLKAITREGWEYDLTVVFDLDMKQQATTSKDRTNMFMNKPQFLPSAETGKQILKWCQTGIEATNGKLPTNNQSADFYEVWQKEVSAMSNKSNLMELYNHHKPTIMEDEKLKDMFKTRQAELTPAKIVKA